METVAEEGVKGVILEEGVSRLRPGETSLDFVVKFCQDTAIDPDVDTARQPDTSGQGVKRQGGANWLHTLHIKPFRQASATQ